MLSCTAHSLCPLGGRRRIHLWPLMAGRFRTSLDAAGYDGATDNAWVVVCPPLPLSVRIVLKRVTQFNSAWRAGGGSASEQTRETCAST